MTKSEPVCIEEFLGPGNISNNVRQTVRVTVIWFGVSVEIYETKWL